MTEEVQILAVDDVEENLIALEMLLERPGLRVVLARSGNDALEALLAHDFALALLDVHMPQMDGFELAELMRGSERTRHVPIIFLTAATPDRNRIFQGYEAGAVDFLFKPIDPHLLLSKIEVFAQLHRQKHQLAQQLEQIQQAQRMSDLFVGVLGHDLRNPLGSIAMSATLLARHPGDAQEIGRKAGLILRASQRMERLIQQVLDFALARVQGGIPVEPADADMATIARQVVAELDVDAIERVRVEVAGETSGQWDADRMMQVVSNLVANALEHGEAAGSILVRIDGTIDDDLVFEVRNEGAIPSDTLEVLFSPFKQTRRSRGIGLGLFIVEQIVRAHGGRVAVTSDEQRGTSLRIWLPRRPLPRRE